MLRICNWIAGLFGYRLMKFQIFECSETMWTKPAGYKTVTVEISQGGAGGAAGSITRASFSGGSSHA